MLNHTFQTEVIVRTPPQREAWELLVRHDAAVFGTARRALGRTAPNPSRVCNYQDEIVGKGFIQERVSLMRKSLLLGQLVIALGATVYVNLEPCNHYGRTVLKPWWQLGLRKWWWAWLTTRYLGHSPVTSGGD